MKESCKVLKDARTTCYDNLTLYVRQDGNDANNGLTDTPQGAFRTVPAAVWALCKYDGRGYEAIIQVGAGTYTDAIQIDERHTACGFHRITIQGSGAGTKFTTLSYNAEGIANNVVVFRGGPQCWLKSCTVTVQDARSGLWVNNSSSAVSDVVFEGWTDKSIGIASDSGDVNVKNVSFAGTWNYCIGGGCNAYIVVEGAIAVSGICSFFAISNFGSNITCTATFSGGISGYRFQVAYNGTINTGARGLNYFPGTTDGIIAEGGRYV